MNRWHELAHVFANAIDQASRHHDPQERARWISEARRALQQFTAAGNVAIEGIRKPINDRSPPSYRRPYADE